MSDAETVLPDRPTSRWLILDGQGRVLLFRFVYSDGPIAGATFWATPGGAVDTGESYEDAARRELFEETGTLLAVDDDGELLADARPFHDHRLKLESHELSLTDVLRESNLNVHADLLRPAARWVGRSERGNWFDTFTFVAANPEGQEPDAHTGEADDANWFPPQLLLDGWRYGLVRLAPSTWAQLMELLTFDTVEEVLAAADGASLAPVIGDPVDDPRYREFFTFVPVDRIGKRHGI